MTSTLGNIDKRWYWLGGVTIGLIALQAIWPMFMEGMPQGPGPAPEPIPGTPPPGQPIPGSEGYKSPGGNPPIPVDFPGRPGPYGPH